MSQANNHFYAHARILQTVWTGVKYAYDPKTDITLAYYHTGQNQYGDAGQNATCNAVTQNAKAAQCSGTLDAVSLFADYHFTKRFDVYAGMEVSNVEGGLAGGTLALGSKVGTAVSASQSRQQLLHQLGSDHRRSLHLLIAFPEKSANPA